MREEFTADQANGRAPSVITIPESSLVVNDAPYPTPVHPASTRDSPVRKAVTASIPDTAATSSTVVSFPTTEEYQSRDESFDEASSRDEDATKAFDQSMMWETPEVLLQPPVPRSSPPIAILPEEKDEDDNTPQAILRLLSCLRQGLRTTVFAPWVSYYFLLGVVLALRLPPTG
ncbi:hypothetical protein K435DRAFT_813908, partial [Dendrothele bispora CBS 962.96]